MSEHTEISAKQLFDRLHHQSDRRWFLLDVRNDDEAQRWPVEGPIAVRRVHIPYFDFIDDPEAALARVPKDLGEAVVVCAKGGSSEFVAGLMRDEGREALNLSGGMLAWGELHVPIRVPLAPEHEGRFELWQINRYGKGCLSYMVIAQGQAAVIDPSRFTDVYTSFATERGAKIVEVMETHVHADHLSGGAHLAKQVGARYRVLNANGPEPSLGIDVLPFTEERTRIELGGAAGVSLVANALRTPGHTPGSVSYWVADRYLLSGDTLFVHGVGRPDLGGQAEAWGRALYQTLRHVIAELPADTVVLPGHFSSTQEESEGGLVRGQLGELRKLAPEFAITDAEQFVAAMKASVKEPPAIYGQIVKANLGLLDPGEQASEWELGKNECAASAARRAASL